MQQLTYFETSPFIGALKKFFADLHLPLHYLADEPAHPRDILGKQFKPGNPAQTLIKDIYALGVVDDAAFGDHKSTFDDIEEVREHQKQYDGILILGVTLNSREKGLLPARGQLAEITRALNREFVSMPVVVVFRYEHYIAFANCERDAYKHASRDGEKAGKVSLLRDIDIDHVHAGHLRILDRLKVPGGISTFDALYQYWLQALNVSLLNKDFYRDLSHWFFAAKKDAKFPDTAGNATEIGLIRLITRLIFTWFVKERKLVPEDLFDPDKFKALLKDPSPQNDSYYRAILQNLFFATLNTEMNTRRFAKETGGPHGQKGDYGIVCFRYSDDLSSPDKWMELIKDIPFLNGGLFECLDHTGKEGNYVDGFSREAKNQAKLPNYLFYGDKFTADLSDVYNDKRQKTVAVTPLLNLLHSYKFTIAENTPLEEDVALDPELLGKVFENLLASYNPETSTTARKQTGSFYTPREIVNYMVEEALYAYLVGACGGTPNSGTPNSDTHNDDNPENGACRRTPLRMLLSDTDSHSAQELGFSPAQIETLVNAINHCTILDPACGSGAFPMGALGKMVALLKKLDPENNLWRAAQLNAVAQRLQNESGSPQAKAEAEAQTHKIFEDNAPDYARKLFLIEKCLFGSDIQPVALQITKLRFFIALIIDQNIDRAKDNWGIRALPNLETKFVAANTLISLPQRGSTLFDTKELQAHKEQLFDKRRQHIAPKNRREKKQLEEDDKKLRALIKDELLDLRFDEDGATMIAEYNPYDQNATAPFFDPEWMFGPDVKDGFDIVIGNPPYINMQKVSEDNLPKDVARTYKTYRGKADILYLFIERGTQLTKEGGFLTFITASYFLKSHYADALRGFISTKHRITRLIDFGSTKVFESASVDCSILLLKAGESPTTFLYGLLKDDDKLADFLQATVSTGASDRGYEILPIDGVNLKESPWSFVLPTSEVETQQLGDICNIGKGAATGCDTVFVVDNSQIKEHQIEKEIIYPLITDSSIARYSFDVAPYSLICTKRGININQFPNAKKFLMKFQTELSNRYAVKNEGLKWYEIVRFNEDLFGPEVTEQIYCYYRTVQNRFAYSNERYATLTTSFVLTPKANVEAPLKFVLGILNSAVIQQHTVDNAKKMGACFELSSNFLKSIPIPTATPGEQAAIASKVEQILAAKAHDPAADVSTLEREIDELVADLYGLDDAEKQLVGIE